MENVLTNEKYIVRRTISNKTQFLHRIRLRTFTANTPFEDCYTNEHLRYDDGFVIPHDDLYSIPWEAESDPSFIGHPRKHGDPLTIDCTHSQDSVTQQTAESKLPRQHKIASDSIAEAPHSSQYYVNTPKIKTLLTSYAPIDIDGTSNVHHDSNLRHDTYSTTSREVNNPADQNDESEQKESLPGGGKRNLRLDPNPNYSDSYS